MTRDSSFDVAVIGGGVMGLATARKLAERKARVVLFERARIGHAQASSHGKSRIIRLAYSDPTYIPLCRAAYSAWHALEAEAGETLLQITGGLDLAFGDVPSWRNSQRAMTEAGVPHDVLGRDVIRQRFPQFDLPDNARGLWQSEAGVLHADRCLASLARRAREQGAVLREGEDVLAVAPSVQTIEIRTASATFNVGRVVIAAGATTSAMLSRLGLDLPLTVSTEQVALFRPKDSSLYGPDRFPIFILHLGGVLLSSGFPLLREAGLKLMIENKRPARDDDETPDPELLAKLEAQVRRILPGLDARAIEPQTCRYTLTPDEDFIIDRHPEYPHIAIVSACSGHGFKFGALFGEAIADLVTDRPPCIKLDPFRIDRPALTEGRAQSDGLNIRRKTS